jgi:hypothetical protein
MLPEARAEPLPLMEDDLDLLVRDPLRLFFIGLDLLHPTIAITRKKRQERKPQTKPSAKYEALGPSLRSLLIELILPPE